jgi:hypothetical protein
LYGTKEGKYWQRIKLWILLAGIADEDYGWCVDISGAENPVFFILNLMKKEAYQAVKSLK